MIEELLPACVVSVEARDDRGEAKLFPEEELVVAKAVEKRRREFTTARACAHTALTQLGFPAVAVPTGERGEPCWPAGVVGSITHCVGYRGAAVARQGEMITLGIDAEPNAALPDGLLGDIARPEELPALARLASHRPEIRWDRLLFSAKESVYKAWFPLAKRWLGFEDALLKIDSNDGTFDAKLLVPGPRLPDGELRGFRGRWAVSDGVILTAIAVSEAEASDMLAGR